MSRATDQLRETLVALIDPICHAHSVDLVDVRYLREPAGAVIRVIIDRAPQGDLDGSGVSLDDCTHVSRDVSTTLDVHDDQLPNGAYRLEVSSPGLERPLVRLADFERFAGRDIKLKTRAAIERQKRFQGKLVGVRDGVIELDQAGTVLNIPHDEIAQATLVYRFSK
ncbi:MAG: ribosome maturation factor RimP [Polyangiales bacterium]